MNLIEDKIVSQMRIVDRERTEGEQYYAQLLKQINEKRREIKKFSVINKNNSSNDPVTKDILSQSFLPHIDKFSDNLINTNMDRDISTLKKLMSIPIAHKTYE